jgi:hypothetical protein
MFYGTATPVLQALGVLAFICHFLEQQGHLDRNGTLIDGSHALID